MSANLSRQGSQSSLTTYATVAVAGTAIGVASLLYIQNNKEQKRIVAESNRIKEAKRKFIQSQLIGQFVKDSKAIKLAHKDGGDVKARDVASKRLNYGHEPKRNVKACFNEYDEMYERAVESDQEQATPGQQDEKPKKEKWASEYIVNLGDPEYDVGKTQVTLDLFCRANGKVKNCETFIDNLDRIRRRHINETIADDSVALETEQGETTGNEDEMILDVDHGKFKKKDHIFMGLFSMYGKSYIQKKRKNEPKQTTGAVEPQTPKESSEKKVMEESSEQTPMYEKNQKRIQMLQKREVYDKNKYRTSKGNASKTQRTPQPVHNIYEKIAQAHRAEAQMKATKS